MPINRSNKNSEDDDKKLNNTGKSDGDIIAMMQAEEAKIADIFVLEKQISNSIDNIVTINKSLERLAKRQVELLESILRKLDETRPESSVENKYIPSTVNSGTGSPGATGLSDNQFRTMLDSFWNEDRQRRAKDAFMSAGYTRHEGLAGKVEGAGHALSGLADIALEPALGEMGAAIGVALTPALGPLGPIVGEVAGDLIGKYMKETIIEEFNEIADMVGEISNQAEKNRTKIIEVAFDKIRKDVTAMSTYQIEIYEQATQKIYQAWDKNLEQVTATQNYTKNQLNDLQDQVAQRLLDAGLQNAINAADYTDVLVQALNANLSGPLAEEFAYQSMVLSKAIPEFNSAQFAEQFAAIWTNAIKEGGSGSEEMVKAMQQIAGATRALREYTDGNNQFIKQIGNYMTLAEQFVARADGNIGQVSELTTQMLAAEAPLSALAPQLSGFTGELVTLLSDQNKSSAVALRAIMHDMNENIGVSATDFMSSFMEDTKGTLTTAFSAIQDFLDRNQAPGAQQEFYQAMEDIFGISSEKIAQIDFGYVAEQLAKTNANLNTAALLDAEALVKEGQTETLEQQLVNNTSNMLLGVNSVRDTLDNNIMRSLEKNELEMEKLIYANLSTQSVDLAESTLEFFNKIKDVLLTVLDPLGTVREPLKLLNSLGSFTASMAANIELYSKTKSLNQIGESSYADRQTDIMTATGASNLAVLSNLLGGNTSAIQIAMNQNSLASSFDTLMLRQQKFTEWSQSAAEESRIAAEETKNAVSTSSSDSESKMTKEELNSEFDKQLALASQQQLELAQVEEQRAQKQSEDLTEIHDIVKEIDDTDYLGKMLESLTEIQTLGSTMYDSWMITWFKETFIETEFAELKEKLIKEQEDVEIIRSRFISDVGSVNTILGLISNKTSQIKDNLDNLNKTIGNGDNNNGNLIKETNRVLDGLSGTVTNFKMTVDRDLDESTTMVESAKSTIEKLLEVVNEFSSETNTQLLQMVMNTTSWRSEFYDYSELYDLRTAAEISRLSELKSTQERFKQEVAEKINNLKTATDSVKRWLDDKMSNTQNYTLSISENTKSLKDNLGQENSWLGRRLDDIKSAANNKDAIENAMTSLYNRLTEEGNVNLKTVVDKLDELKFELSEIKDRLVSGNLSVGESANRIYAIVDRRQDDWVYSV